MTENEIIYRERYIAFIDILGFSNIVRNSEKSPHQAELLVEALDRIGQLSSNQIEQLTDDIAGTDFKAQSFSDCTVMSEAATPKGLHYLIARVTQFALDLLATGFLVRGGIAKGNLYHSGHAVFGPALLDAYVLERDIAKYPRIIVDRATHKDFEQHKLPDGWDHYSRPVLRHALDGPPFVDVLASWDGACDISSRTRVSAWVTESRDSGAPAISIFNSIQKCRDVL